MRRGAVSVQSAAEVNLPLCGGKKMQKNKNIKKSTKLNKALKV